jgi:hypothetical protein
VPNPSLEINSPANFKFSLKIASKVLSPSADLSTLQIFSFFSLPSFFSKKFRGWRRLVYLG